MAWKKGQSGNPKGRPRGSGGKPTYETILRKVKDRGITWQHPDYGVIDDPTETALVITWAAAMNGESWACKELLDRGLGRPHQTMDIESDHTERREFVHEIREALGNGKAGQIADMAGRIRIRSDDTEPCDDGADSDGKRASKRKMGSGKASSPAE